MACLFIVRYPAVAGWLVKYPATGLSSMKRSCFWLSYWAQIVEPDSNEDTWSPYTRERCIAFRAFTT